MPEDGEAKKVTQARRELILWCLWIHGPGNSASITKLLVAHIDNKRIAWPEAKWQWARNKPYQGGTVQHLNAMARGERPVVEKHLQLFDWNRAVLKPRAHAEEVRTLRAQGHTNGQIEDRLGIGKSLASALYNDPFGLREQERKRRYCPGCGSIKVEDQTICLACVRRRRERVEDEAEALLPDPIWARSLVLALPVDFAITDQRERLLIVHTERGKIEHRLARGESWEHAVEDLGVLRG